MYSKEILQNILNLNPRISKFSLCLYNHIKENMKDVDVKKVPRRNYVVSRKNLIKKVELLAKTKNKEWAGRYRNANVIIGGSKHAPPDALQVPQKMRDLIS